MFPCFKTRATTYRNSTAHKFYEIRALTTGNRFLDAGSLIDHFEDMRGMVYMLHIEHPGFFASLLSLRSAKAPVLSWSS